MIDQTLDFPFVSELPKREKSRLLKVWEMLEEMRAVSKQHGQLIPSRLAAKLLGVSKARIDQLMDAGKLYRVEIDDHPFVAENSLVDLARSERKTGRPPKVGRGQAVPCPSGVRARSVGKGRKRVQ